MEAISKEFIILLNPLYTKIAIEMKKMEDLMFPILSCPEKLDFEEYEKIRQGDLPSLTHEQLEFLVWKKTGKKDLTKYWENTIVDEKIERTLEERRLAAVNILYKGACRYCHVVTHSKETCPSLERKYRRKVKNVQQNI